MTGNPGATGTPTRPSREPAFATRSTATGVGHPRCCRCGKANERRKIIKNKNYIYIST